MQILAVGNASANESEIFLIVEEILKQKGHEVLMFKQDKCLENEYLVFETINGIPIYSVIIDGIKYNVENFETIWYMHPMLPRELILYKRPKYRQFIHSQFFGMRQALWSFFKHKKWIDNPWKVLMLENKVYQIKLAYQAGFSMPDTIITSDPDSVCAFHEKHGGNIIVKNFMTSPIMDYVIATNIVTSEYMDQIESVKLAPSIFQEYVPKKYELRITVVGSKIFTTKIHSQEDEATAIDWRVKPKLNDFTVRMESTEIPFAIKKQIGKFMELAGLRFGCIDMIVTPDDRYIFLEINPNGQWYFVQTNTGVKIAEEIASLLVT